MTQTHTGTFTIDITPDPVGYLNIARLFAVQLMEGIPADHRLAQQERIAALVEIVAHLAQTGTLTRGDQIMGYPADTEAE